METNDYYNKIISLLEKPYFQNLMSMGISNDLYEIIFERIFNHPVIIEYKENNSIYNKEGKSVYIENSLGKWVKKEYDKNGNEIYYEQSDGYWYKREYNDNGDETYFENSKGHIIRYEYGYLLREDKITIG